MNNSRIVITSSEDFEKIIAQLESTIPIIDEIFQDESNKMLTVDNTEVWMGPTQQIITEKYNDLAKNYKPFVDGLSTYIRFLKNTIANYKKQEEIINQNIEINETNINVN
mgnify:CR=1 FL=1